jgi:hypothetical protein
MRILGLIGAVTWVKDGRQFYMWHMGHYHYQLTEKQQSANGVITMPVVKEWTDHSYDEVVDDLESSGYSFEQAKGS